MECFRTRYSLGEKIGDGNFAEVKVCICKESGAKFAAKIIRKKTKNVFGNYDSNSRGMTATEIQREVNVLRSIKHENIVRFHELYEGEDCAVLLLELVEGGELFARVAELDKLAEDEASGFIKQILYGVEHMHRLGIVHLDLKPENIMIADMETKMVKIIDFGLARHLNGSESIQEMAGTPEFCAPEIVNFDPITFATDMWAIGVMTYILLSGISPFAGDTQIETFQNVLECTVGYDREEFKDISEMARDFIDRLLKKNPRKRSTASECLHHSWICSSNMKQVIEKIDLSSAFAMKSSLNGYAIKNEQILPNSLQAEKGESIFNEPSHRINGFCDAAKSEKLSSVPQISVLSTSLKKSEVPVAENAPDSEDPNGTTRAPIGNEMEHYSERNDASNEEKSSTSAIQHRKFSVESNETLKSNSSSSTIISVQDSMNITAQDNKAIQINETRTRMNGIKKAEVCVPVSTGEISKGTGGSLLERASKWLEARNQAFESRRNSIFGQTASSKWTSSNNSRAPSIPGSIEEKKLVFTKDSHHFQNVSLSQFKWKVSEIKRYK